MLAVRKLHERDWAYLPKWWEAYGQDVPQRAFLPENGLGGFVVLHKKDPIAAMFLWLTNSKTAIPAVVIADKTYRAPDRSDALQLLVDFTVDFAESLGCEFAFAWSKPGLMLEQYKENGFMVDDTPSYELIKQYKWEQS